MGRILNFGSLNIDHVYQVRRFVRPGETIASLAYARNPGGKGLNQSVALARGGAEIWHGGRVGPDGLFLLDTLEKSGVHTGLVDTSGQVTGHACIQVDEQGQNCIVLYGGANQEILPGYREKTLEGFGPGDILLAQNETNDVTGLLESAAGRGMAVALNPSPMDEALLSLDYHKVTWLLLNEVEGEDITGKREPDEITGELLRRFPNLRVVLTLGGKGAVYHDRRQRLFQPALRVKAVDTTAAGDTFTGFFLAALSRGEKEAHALALAAEAAAIAVSRPGAGESIPSLEEVLALAGK